MARPSGYNPELAASICAEIASGQSIRALTAKDGMPSERAIYSWLAAHQPFQQMYARACEQRVEVFVEDLIAIGNEVSDATYTDTDGNVRIDTGAVQAARLKTDNIKWLMAKMAPRKYGDRIEHVVRPGAPEQLSDAELARIAAPTASVLIEHRADEQSAPDLCTGIGEQDQ